VVVGVGGHAGTGGVVDVEQAVFAVIVVAEPAVEGEVAVVIVGIGRAVDGGVLVEAGGPACRGTFCGILGFCLNRRASRSVFLW
jgi:hypothetical protein